MNNCLATGSFDPMTSGHLELVENARKIFDKVYIGILSNSSKKYMFTLEERIKIAKDATINMDNVFVESFSGLAVNLAKELKALTIVRGVRNSFDYQYERDLAMLNHSLCKDVQTIFIPSHSDFVSSSFVRELINLKGDYKQFLSDEQYLSIQNILKNEV